MLILFLALKRKLFELAIIIIHFYECKQYSTELSIDCSSNICILYLVYTVRVLHVDIVYIYVNKQYRD